MNCKKCGLQFDAKDNSCPHCEAAAKQEASPKKGSKKTKLIIAGAVAFILLVAGTLVLAQDDLTQWIGFRESRQAYELAQTLLAADDYAGAIAQLQLVEEGYRYYGDAQVLLASAKTDYLIFVIQEAEGLIQKYEYADAVDFIDTNLGQMPENVEIIALYERAKALNTARGNTASNINHVGRVAFDDEWTYYSPIGGGGIYRIRHDGTSTEKIGDSEVLYLNVFDGWLYYQHTVDDRNESIHRMRTDGSSIERINFKSSWHVSIVSGWIYYTSGIDIYRMRPDGSNDEVFKKGSQKDEIQVNNPQIVDDWMYYVSGINRTADFHVERMHTVTGEVDSTQWDPGPKNAAYYTVSEGWLYMPSTDSDFVTTVYRTNVETGEKEIVAGGDIGMMRFNINDGWIYFSTREGKIYRRSVSGGGSQLLFDSKERYFSCWFFVTDNGVYFQWSPHMGEMNKMQRMDHDGSNLKVLD